MVLHKVKRRVNWKNFQLLPEFQVTIKVKPDLFVNLTSHKSQKTLLYINRKEFKILKIISTES